MSPRDRQRSRAKIKALVEFQAIEKAKARVLEDFPPGVYWIKSKLSPELIKVEKPGYLH